MRRFKHVKESEELQMLRNLASVLDEVVCESEGSSSAQGRHDQRSRHFVHVLVPHQPGGPRKKQNQLHHQLHHQPQPKAAHGKDQFGGGAAGGAGKDAKLLSLQGDVDDVHGRMQQLQRTLSGHTQQQNIMHGELQVLHRRIEQLLALAQQRPLAESQPG